MRVIKWIVVLLLVGIVGVFALVPAQLEKGMNIVEPHTEYVVSLAAKELHESLIIGDWHADSALWNRDLAKHGDRGQVDLPRLREGNVALQMFTTVTKSPSGQNYDRNESTARDNITSLVLVQRWPFKTWNSLTARAIHQSEKLHELAAQQSNNFRLIKTRADLSQFFLDRERNRDLVGGLIGTEGSHALDGDLENIKVLFDNGFRMMSLQHFFDNKLGGSLHGISMQGLTEFGRRAVAEMERLNIILDVSHSSERVVEEMLQITSSPLIVSHTGFKGFCDSPRNIRDELMLDIARGGGLIAVGYWDGAICGNSPQQIAKAINYGIGLVGAEHVALGSDFDGSVTTALDTSEVAAITQSLLDLGVSEDNIRNVMGANMHRFLANNLPN